MEIISNNMYLKTKIHFKKTLINYRYVMYYYYYYVNVQCNIYFIFMKCILILSRFTKTQDFRFTPSAIKIVNSVIFFSPLFLFIQLSFMYFQTSLPSVDLFFFFMKNYNYSKTTFVTQFVKNEKNTLANFTIRLLYYALV